MSMAGELAMKIGYLAEAKTWFEEVIRRQPTYLPARVMLGDLLHSQQQTRAAMMHFRIALQQSNEEPIWRRLAICCRASQDIDGEIEAYENILRLRPDDTAVRYNRGLLLHKRGNYLEAIDELQQVLTAIPQNTDVIYALGFAWEAEGSLVNAIRVYRELLEKTPDHISANINLGRCYFLVGQMEEALPYCDTAIRLAPELLAPHYNRARVLQQLERWQESLHGFDDCITLDPDHIDAHYNRGVVLQVMGRRDEAWASYAEVLRLNPDYPQVHNNLGVLFYRKGLIDKAVDAFRTGIRLAPGQADNYANLANIQQEKGDHAAAISGYDKAISLRPDFAEAHVNKAFSLFYQGKYAEGWREYRWRLLGKRAHQLPENWDKNAWRLDLPVSRLRLFAEQGLGDEILYASQWAELQTYVDQLSITTDPRLLPLFRRSLPGIDWRAVSKAPLSLGDSIPCYPIGSVGEVLRPDWASFTGKGMPYLRVDPHRHQQLREQLTRQGTDPRPLCGIAWRSHNPEEGANKSIPLKDLMPILGMPNYQFVNLQYGDTQAEQDQLVAQNGLRLHSIPGLDLYNDLDGLAALVAACDVVVTVSSVTAHLAGALGIKTWLLLSMGTGRFWYWNGPVPDRTVWYDSVRIIRQTKSRQWQEAIFEVVHRMSVAS